MSNSSGVWYNLYRPVLFAEIVGQEHITTVLSRAVAQGRVAHAYLFSGSRGTGKTSAARILARAVNCTRPTDPPNGEPCLDCRYCVASLSGRAVDLIELDAASSRGIDEIRSLRDQVRFSPTVAKKKIYLVDEAHALTQNAADALLKTLEEPPAHAIFILATTDPQKVPLTIRSRCQQHGFRRLASADIAARLTQIAQQELVQGDQDALLLIAQQASGSMRDAIGMLEMFADQQPITREIVMRVLGIVEDERVAQLAQLILARKLRPALDLVTDAVEAGMDLRQFTKALVDYLRTFLLIRARSTRSLALAADDLQTRTELANQYKGPYLARVAQILSRLDLRADPYSPLPLELAIVECMQETK